MFEMLLIFVVLMSIIAVMSIGVLFGKKPISGSCGGLSGLEPGRECPLCGRDPTQCVEQ